MPKHAEYSDFFQLPDDAQRAFRGAVSWFQRTHQDAAPQVGIWSDLAEKEFTLKMQYARPEIVGLQRTRGLILAARRTILETALAWQKTAKRVGATSVSRRSKRK